jgi:protein involved in polysaccharide export with SLBB domain
MTPATRLLICIVVGSTMSLTACGSPRGLADASVLAGDRTHLSAYRLMPGDKVRVNVFNEPDFSGEFQVNDAGNIAFPLVGEVPAAGASPSEFAKTLTARLRGGFVRNPRVTVEVVNYRPINVLGEVRNAGQYPFRADLTVQDAIALAGGYTYRANTHTVYIRHAGASGEITARTDGERVVINPGDTVRVPQRYF